MLDIQGFKIIKNLMQCFNYDGVEDLAMDLAQGGYNRVIHFLHNIKVFYKMSCIYVLLKCHKTKKNAKFVTVLKFST
jgi:dimeric dUTPase (all-alpha-NTP-PPase superfamily)